MHGKRFNIDGHGRFLTFSCFKNRPFFNSERACEWFIDALSVSKTKYAFDLWAYVIMPNHVHLLMFPKNGEDVPRILKFMKLKVTNTAIEWLGKNNPDGQKLMIDMQPNGRQHLRFWQRGEGYDRNIFSAEEAHEKIRYIHANPIRAGLADSENEWKWSSYLAWETDSAVPIAIDRESFPIIQR